MHGHFLGRQGHARHLIHVEVVLLHLAVLEADFTHHRIAQAHDAGALELGADALGVDLRTAVYGNVRLVHDHRAIVLDLHLEHRRHVSDKAVVHRQPQATALGQLRPQPAAFAAVSSTVRIRAVSIG